MKKNDVKRTFTSSDIAAEEKKKTRADRWH